MFYYLRKPNPQKTGQGHRATFVICQREGEDGLSKTKQLSLEAITSINRLYARNELSYPQALKMAEDVLAKLKAKASGPPKVFHSENARILDSYWEAVYEHKDQVDKSSMRYDLSRAVSALGSASLASATKLEMQAALKKSLGDSPNLQRRACSRLNQILRFVGRNFTLDKMREEYREVRYITHAQLSRVVDRIEDPNFRLLCHVAFATGARLGECFTLEARSYNGKMIQITTQLDEEEEKRQTKNRKRRKALVIKAGRPYLEQWLKLSDKEKLALRHIKHARTVKAAAANALEGKYLVFHDLRHSYAVHLLERGCSLDMVAQFLGNSNAVCEKYYVGFVATDLTIDMADEITERFEKSV